MNLGEMNVKGYFTLTISTKLEPQSQMLFIVIPQTPSFWGGKKGSAERIRNEF